MDFKKLAVGLSLSAQLFAGCGGDGGGTGTTITTSTTSTTRPDMGLATECSDATTATLYRLNVLHIPTTADANAGLDLGHNLDGIGTDCEQPDLEGGVDNLLMDLAATLGALGDDPISLQAEIDAGLTCTAGSTTCERIDLIVSVRTGANCVIVEVEDAAGASLAGPFVGSLDGSGRMYGEVAVLNITIPFRTDTGTQRVELALRDVIISGTIGTGALTNIVIGGVLRKAEFEPLVTTLATAIGGLDPQAALDIVDDLYDVRTPPNNACEGLSVGLTASGVPFTP